MNLELKVLVDNLSKRFADELFKRFDEQDLKWDKRLSDRDEILGVQVHRPQQSPSAALMLRWRRRRGSSRTGSWRTEPRATIDDLHLEVKKLNKHYHQSATLKQPASSQGIFPSSSLVIGCPPPRVSVERPSGHWLLIRLAGKMTMGGSSPG
ncbi:unnamed protein product [Urochloa humidicola]